MSCAKRREKLAKLNALLKEYLNRSNMDVDYVLPALGVSWAIACVTDDWGNWCSLFDSFLPTLETRGGRNAILRII